MRIISGKAKGLRLITPKGLNTRPTSDRVKESVFNIILPYIYDSKVLDLFSGTGNLAIESISRGSSIAYLVEKDIKCINIIKENISKAKFNDKINILNQDVFNAIEYLGKDNQQFDIIFMDPPYLKGLIVPCLEKIIENNILKDTGIIVVEHDIKDKLEPSLLQLSKCKEKKYGNTIITIYSKEDTNDSGSIPRQF